MGMFGGGYAKPGPGVDKEAPKKKGIFLYFEIFTRKFWKLIQVNLLYFLTSLPIIAIYYILAPVTSKSIGSLIPEAINDSDMMATAQMGFRAMFSMILFMLWGSGPSTAAYTFVTRNFVREKHSWIFSDFFTKFKENFKQGIIVVIIDVAVLFLSYTALPLYYYQYTATNSVLWLVICYVIALSLFIYTIIHYYIYQLMITFECTTMQLYRNSVVMAFAKLPMNIVFTIMALVLIYLAFMVNAMISLVLSAVIWTSVVIFPIVFYTSRVIQKSFLDKIQTESQHEEIEPICSDTLNEKD